MKKKILLIASILLTLSVAIIGYEHVTKIAEAGLISSAIIFCILNTAWAIASGLMDIAWYIDKDNNAVKKKRVLTVQLEPNGDGKFKAGKVTEVEVDLDAELEMDLDAKVG